MEKGTKWKGDLAEQAVILEAMKRGFDVSIPVGDRLSYDLIFDIKGVLIRIQVKCAWFDEKTQNYVTDVRMCKTNRKRYKYVKYINSDFDFAIIAILEKNVFYIMPSEVFNSYGSGITLAEAEKRQRKPKSFDYREAWDLLKN